MCPVLDWRCQHGAREGSPEEAEVQEPRYDPQEQEQYPDVRVRLLGAGVGSRTLSYVGYRVARPRHVGRCHLDALAWGIRHQDALTRVAAVIRLVASRNQHDYPGEHRYGHTTTRKTSSKSPAPSRTCSCPRHFIYLGSVGLCCAILRRNKTGNPLSAARMRNPAYFGPREGSESSRFEETT